MGRALSMLLVSLLCCGAQASETKINSVTYKSIEGTANAMITNIGSGKDVIDDLCGSVTIDGKTYTVTVVGEYACNGKQEIKKIILPATIREIQKGAFASNRNLKEVILNEGLLTIGEIVFEGCFSIPSIHIPASVTGVDGTAFDTNEYVSGDENLLSSITVDENNTSYASHNGILFNKSKTEIIMVPPAISGNISLPNTLITLNKPIRSKYITSVTIPRSLREISYITGGENFEKYIVDEKNPVFCAHDGILYYKSDKSICSVPEGIKGDIEILDGCNRVDGFVNRTGITSIKLPESVTGIYNLSGCTGLANINIPQNVTYIENFTGCTGLKSVILPEHDPNDISNTLYIEKGAFSNCTGLTSIYLPLKDIRGSLFKGCSNLTDIKIWEYASTLDCTAFEGTGWWENQKDGPVYVDNFLYNIKGTLPENIILKNGTQRFSEGFFKQFPYIINLEFNSDFQKLSDNIGDCPIDNIKINGPIFIDIHSLCGLSGTNVYVNTAAMPYLKAINKSSDGGGMGMAYPTETVMGYDYAHGTESGLLGTLYVPNGMKDKYMTVAESNEWLRKYNTLAYFCKDVTEVETTVENAPDTNDGLTYRYDYEFRFATLTGKKSNDIEEITISKNLTYDNRNFEVRAIDGYALSGHKEIKKVSIPESVVKIGAYVFENCGTIDEVYYNSNVESNNIHTIFQGCEIGCLTIGANVAVTPDFLYDTGDRYGQNCLRVCNYNVDGHNANFTVRDGALYNKNLTTLIRAPYKNPQTRNAIENTCLHLAKETCTIGKMALKSVNYDVYIPSGITTIEKDGLTCDGTLHLEWSVPPTLNSSLHNCTIVVPAKYRNNYENAAGWGEAGKILTEDEYTGVPGVRADKEDKKHIYDLRGYSTSNTSSLPVYITNGKKYIFKQKK